MSGTPAPADRRSGWITLSAVVLFAVAFARIVSGIHYLRGGSQIADLSGTLFGGDLWAFGLWDLVLAILALGAGLSLLLGGGFGRLMAYIWATWAIVQGFVIIGQQPWYAVATMALAVMVVYALASTASWGEED